MRPATLYFCAGMVFSCSIDYALRGHILLALVGVPLVAVDLWLARTGNGKFHVKENI